MKRIVTHLAALGLGLLLAAHLRGHAGRGGAAVAGEEAARPVRPVGTDRHAVTAGGTMRAGDGGGQGLFQAAWRELGSRRVGRGERLAAQTALLKQWAEVDLAGALRAAAAEDHGDLKKLLGAFDEVIRARPQEMWALVASDIPLGLNAELLREAWVRGVAASDPGLVMSRVAELPERLRERAMEAAFQGMFEERSQTSTSQRLLEILAGEPGSGELEERMRLGLGRLREVLAEHRMELKAEPLATLRQRWQGVSAGGAGEAERPAKRVALAKWADRLSSASREEFATEWGAVPEADRREARRMALTMCDGASPAMLTLLDEAMAAGEWADLARHGKERLEPRDPFVPMGDPDAMAAWALGLPERPETLDLYLAAVSDKLFHAEGIAWLEQLPAGDWRREQGLMELARRGPYLEMGGLAEQAIAAIADPEMKRRAQERLDRVLARKRGE